MNRWYDKYKKLAAHLDSFKTMKKNQRDKLVSGILEIVQMYDNSLIDNSVMDFPLELPRRRWYDKDPYLWLIFNGLKNADEILLKKITDYLEKETLASGP